jgi:hypothetical protein
VCISIAAAPPWQRRALLLQKLRLCSVVFDGVDPSATAYDTDREIKRNTLLEVLEYADAQSRSLFSDLRVLDDTFTMVSGETSFYCNITYGFCFCR